MLEPSNQSAPVDWQSRLQSQANGVQLALRNFLSWTPGPYREKPAGAGCLASLPDDAVARAESILSQYGLTDLPHRAALPRVMETLTYLDWLDDMPQAAPDWFNQLMAYQNPLQTGANGHVVPVTDSTLRWLDVGAKNWAYVDAISQFIQTRHGANFQLDGVELDPHRRYTNWQTRGQAARAFIQDIPQAAYHQGDILQWQQPAQVISLFLPFVFEEPHLAWGLPMDYFQPQALLEHVLSLLPPGGILILINQGEVEAQAQAEILQRAASQFPLDIKSLGQMPARFIEYRYPRLGWLCRKQT